MLSFNFFSKSSVLLKWNSPLSLCITQRYFSLPSPTDVFASLSKIFNVLSNCFLSLTFFLLSNCIGVPRSLAVNLPLTPLILSEKKVFQTWVWFGNFTYFRNNNYKNKWILIWLGTSKYYPIKFVFKVMMVLNAILDSIYVQTQPTCSLTKFCLTLCKKNWD